MKSVHFISVVVLSLLPMMSNAGRVVCDSDALHCTTFAMMPGPQGQQPEEQPVGRYIKATGSFGNQSDTFVDCFDVNSSIEFPEDAVDSGLIHVGDVFKAEYKQCKDRYCHESIAIGNESFTVQKRPGKGYTSTPDSYVVQLNEKYGQACKPDFSKVAMTRVHVR